MEVRMRISLYSCDKYHFLCHDAAGAKLVRDVISKTPFYCGLATDWEGSAWAGRRTLKRLKRYISRYERANGWYELPKDVISELTDCPALAEHLAYPRSV